MGELCYDDIANVAQHFPMQAPDGSVCWAVAGGGAVKFLLEANAVANYQILVGRGFPQRHHKDLDIAVFQPAYCQRRLKRPLEIFWTAYWGPLQRYNYSVRKPFMTGFCVEMLTGYYYSFPPPLPTEIVYVETPEGSLWTLTPEYIIASRLFHTREIRDEIDDRDVRSLRTRFALDTNKIAAVVGRSACAFIPPMTIEQAVMRDEYRGVERAITEEIMQQFSHLATSKLFNGGDIPPLIHRSLIGLHPQELSVAGIRTAIEKARQFHEELSKRNDDGAQWFWALVFALYHLEVTIPLPLKRAINECLRLSVYKGGSALSLAVELCQALYSFRAGLAQTRLTPEFPAAVLHILQRFFTTQFRNVLIAELATMGDKLSSAPDKDAAQERLGEFLSFVGWPSWRRKRGVR